MLTVQGMLGMDAVRVYALLEEACHLLDEAEEYAIAAHVGQSMIMMEARFGPFHTPSDHGQNA